MAVREWKEWGYRFVDVFEMTDDGLVYDFSLRLDMRHVTMDGGRSQLKLRWTSGSDRVKGPTIRYAHTIEQELQKFSQSLLSNEGRVE